MKKIALIALSTLLLSPATRAEDWTQWRGPQRDGVSLEKGLLPAWPTGGPKLVWQLKEAGYGFGAPSVTREKLYILGSEGKDSEFLRAFSARNGKLLWSTRLGKVGNPDQQPSYPGARSTPTVDGKNVYALSSDGDLACVDATTGKLLWTKSLRTEFGGRPGVWAYAESPLIDGDKVIVSPGGEKAGIVALNKKTGAVIWKSVLPGADLAGYASPIVVTVGGVRQYVAYLSKGLVGVDAATGAFLWRYDKSVDTRFGVHAATPVAAGNLIYSAAATGGGLAKLGGAPGTFSAESGYVERKAPNALGGAVKVENYLYGTTSAVLLCTEFATGKVVWENRSVGAASVCVANGLLYLHGENGEVALAEATPTGYQEKGRFTPANSPELGQSKAWAYPVVANGRLYIRALGSLWCYDIKASGK